MIFEKRKKIAQNMTKRSANKPPRCHDGSYMFEIDGVPVDAQTYANILWVDNIKKEVNKDIVLFILTFIFIVVILPAFIKILL